MNEKEIISTNISKYLSLKRIIMANNPVLEAENQLVEAKSILEACGVVVEKLEIKKDE